MKKQVMITTGILGMIMIMASLASAFGVATPYWKENPLQMFPGEDRTVTLVLQNPTDEPVVFDLEIMRDGEGVAKFENLAYTVPPKSYDVRVPIRLEVPENFQYGGRHQIEVQFTPVISVDPVGGTALTFKTQFTTGFPVIITTEEESTFYTEPEKTSALPYIVGGLIVLVIVLLILVIVMAKRKPIKKKK